MVVPAAEAAPLEVVEPKLALHLLVDGLGSTFGMFVPNWSSYEEWYCPSSRPPRFSGARKPAPIDAARGLLMRR